MVVLIIGTSVMDATITIYYAFFILYKINYVMEQFNRFSHQLKVCKLGPIGIKYLLNQIVKWLKWELFEVRYKTVKIPQYKRT